MIGILTKILSIDDFYGVSDTIDTAKGKNKLPQNIKEGWQQYKRKKAWQ